MSPSYQQDSVAFHFTWINDVPAVVPVLAGIEAQLAPFGARPHWGKLFCTSPEVVSRLYDRMPDFRRLLRDLDPAGKFRHEMLDTSLRAGGSPRPSPGPAGRDIQRATPGSGGTRRASAARRGRRGLGGEQPGQRVAQRLLPARERIEAGRGPGAVA